MLPRVQSAPRRLEFKIKNVEGVVKNHEPTAKLVPQFSDLVGVQRLLVALALVLELVGEQRLLGAHGGESDLVLVVVPVLPQAVEAVLLAVGLGGAHAPDDAGGHHQRRHGGGWRGETHDPSHTPKS